MNILVIGDVVGNNGTSFLCDNLRKVKREYEIDFTVVNGENSAEGNGILPNSADRIFDAGADVITLGNHALRRREIYEYLDENEYICRPYNFHPTASGKGYCVYDNVGKPKIAVINLCGMTNIDCAYENPFSSIEKALGEIKADIILVDFHAEATSEKVCMGYFLDGRVTAVYGTHTHIQTADERIFPKGTAYITDIGMCGSFNSSLGVTFECALKRFTTNLPTRFMFDSGKVRMSGIVLTIDDNTKKATKIERINIE